jgi:hypothetical protein
MTDSRIGLSGSSPKEAARTAAADLLDVLRAVWKMLSPEQRAEFFESAHHSPEAARRETP